MSNSDVSPSTLPVDPFDRQIEHEEAASAGFYTKNLDAAFASADDLPSDLKAAVVAHLRDVRQLTDSGVMHARMALGKGKLVSKVDASGRLVRGWEYDGGHIPGMPNPDGAMFPFAGERLRQNEDSARQLETTAQEEASKIVSAALLASAHETPAPAGATDAKLGEMKADVQRLIDAQPDAQERYVAFVQLLKRAVAEDDATMQHLLFSDRLRLDRQRWGIDENVLAAQFFQWRLARAREQITQDNPQALPGSELDSPYAPKYARFLAPQFDPNTALGSAALGGAQRLRTANEHLARRTRVRR